jgi:hypothetical protein
VIDVARPSAPTDLIVARAAASEARIARLCIGLTWTTCATDEGLGLAMSPGVPSRVLPWPGTVAGRQIGDVAGWLSSWNPFEATVGLAAANAVINTSSNPLMARATALAPGNLAVFEHFRPRLAGRKVVVIGRYPGLDRVLKGLDVTVIERQPAEGDLPDTAAELIVPDADWVFLTATTLINKTFHRLAALSREAVTVLMGPSTPWLAEWADFGIDFLAGVRVVDQAKAEQIAAEGGGTRLFEGGVQYAVADVGHPRMEATKAEIATTVARRDALKAEMTAWHEGDNAGRFPQGAVLSETDAELSRLDTRFKRMWDARNGCSSACRRLACGVQVAPCAARTGQRQRVRPRDRAGGCRIPDVTR